MEISDIKQRLKIETVLPGWREFEKMKLVLVPSWFELPKCTISLELNEFFEQMKGCFRKVTPG